MKAVQGKPKEYHIASIFEFHGGRKHVESLLFRGWIQSKKLNVSWEEGIK